MEEEYLLIAIALTYLVLGVSYSIGATDRTSSFLIVLVIWPVVFMFLTGFIHSYKLEELFHKKYLPEYNKRKKTNEK